jgi:hypothetical protein
VFAFSYVDDLMGRGWERHWAKCVPCGEGLGFWGNGEPRSFRSACEGKGVVIEGRKGVCGIPILVSARLNESCW